MNLGQKARSAVIWNTAFNLFRDFLQFGTMLVLVRVLPPEAYGKFGMVMSIVGFLGIFSFNSFLFHIIQIQDDDSVDYHLHFTAGAIINLTMFLVAHGIAAVLHSTTTYRPVANLLHVLSFTFLLEWPCEFRRKMLERAFDWKRLRLLHGAGLLCSSTLAVLMGLRGAGAYALVVPGITVTLPFIFDLFIVTQWRPDWRWSWQNYRAAWVFGWNRIGSGLAMSGRQLLESSTLVKSLGYAQLGVFNRSLGLSQMFCLKFSVQLMYAIYPVLTRLNSDPSNTMRVNGLVLRVVAWVVIPTATVFSALAEPVVAFIYGKQWVAVIPLLPWAMLSGVAVSLAYTLNYLLLSQRRPRLCLYADILNLLGTITLLALALQTGVKFYLAGLALLNLGIVGLAAMWLCKMQALDFNGLMRALVPPAIASGFSLAVCEVCCRITQCQPHTPLEATGYGLSMVLVYILLLRLAAAPHLSELLPYLPGRAYAQRLLLLRT